jgi:alpha-tubulin suppressor-like RCC1 family protein
MHQNLLRFKDSNKSNAIIIRISCGPDYSLLLFSDGDIYSFGCNDFGQLGNNYFQNQSIPTKILTQNQFIDIETIGLSNWCEELNLIILNIFLK